MFKIETEYDIRRRVFVIVAKGGELLNSSPIGFYLPVDIYNKISSGVVRNEVDMRLRLRLELNEYDEPIIVITDGG